MKKVPVGILGATGMVGQQYIRLLEGHPWFEVAYVAASPQSAGKKYKDALRNGWIVRGEMPEGVKNLVVQDVADVDKAVAKCAFVFSAFEMPDKDMIRTYEESYAAAGLPVISNASAHRHTDDVPMLIAEINPHHLDIIPAQQKARGWKKGFIVVKPNCSIQSYMSPIHALLLKGYDVKRIVVTTMQAVSGAGYPGVPSWDVIDNLIPFMAGEEDKTQFEPYKIWGDIKGGKIIPKKGDQDFRNVRTRTYFRRPLCHPLDRIRKEKPSKEKIIEIWRAFKGEPQRLDLPFAPKHAITYKDEEDRPQPRRDRDNDKGMTVTVGRLRECQVLDYKFVGLSHNTVRGAAGGGILNAELVYKKGLIVAS